MENFKVKLEVFDENEKLVGSVMVDSKQIKTLRELHGISALDQALDMFIRYKETSGYSTIIKS